MKPRHLIPAVLCALLIGYPLSLGPAARFIRLNYPYVPAPKWVVVYTPLQRICEHVPPLDDAMRWYVGLWLPKPGYTPGYSF